ncbi:hypothetical protein [Candidatus Williamhamiltonella defendens]|nr:hypothetical protein [Candidatus Hamiltonella defensa]
MFLIHFYTCIDNLSLSPGFYQVAKLTMPLQICPEPYQAVDECKPAADVP